MPDDLKGITYANQPKIGIPISENLLASEDVHEYISAAVYLSYRYLDGSYPYLEKINELIKESKSKLVYLNKTNPTLGYRWKLSIALLETYIELRKNPPKLRTDILENAYYTSFNEDQLCNYSKIATLLYYIKDLKDIKEDLSQKINQHISKSIDAMGKNTIETIILPLLSEDKTKIQETIKKYKNWHIHRDYIHAYSIIYTKNPIYKISPM